MNGLPDALIFPESAKVGRTFNERVANLAKRAEAMLGLDYAAGGRAHIRPAVNERVFVSPSPHENPLFPIGHERERQPRYRWEWQDDDVQFGFFIDDEAAKPIVVDPVILARIAADRRRARAAT
jgi:hypothetical protein